MTYNGWANYATWRVNLEVVDEIIQNCVADEMTFSDEYELKEALKDQTDDIVVADGEGLAVDYARAFLDDVDWYEIVDHAIADYPQLIATDEDDDQDDETDDENGGNDGR